MAKWKLLLIIVAAVVLGFAALVILLEIDGRAHERRKTAAHLRTLYRAWLVDDAPLPVEPLKYGKANWGTGYVYSATHVIGGTNHYGLFAFRYYDRPIHYAITTNGVVLDLGHKKGVCLVRFGSARGAGW
jgi:hypothetical protein